jgi:hypothetical protein
MKEFDTGYKRMIRLIFKNLPAGRYVGSSVYIPVGKTLTISINPGIAGDSWIQLNTHDEMLYVRKF